MVRPSGTSSAGMGWAQVYSGPDTPKISSEFPSRSLLKSPPAMTQFPASYSDSMSAKSISSCSSAMVPSEV